MRFSLTTLWLKFKVRLIVAGLIVGLGFYFGMTHHALIQTFWPGTAAFAGFTVFLGLCFLTGLGLPIVGKKSISLLGVEMSPHSMHPLVMARTVFPILAGASLVVILFSAWVTQWICRGGAVLPERFLVDRFTWQAMTFLLPFPAVALPGVILGFIAGFAFIAFCNLECPAHVQSDEPQVQTITARSLGRILGVLTVGWVAGYYSALAFPDRRLGLTLVPVIACLSVFLASLIEPPGETERVRRASGSDFRYVHSFPQLAGRTHRWTGFTVTFLGWFAVWNLVTWSFTANWLGADPVTADQAVGLTVLAAGALVAGIRQGYRFSLAHRSRYLTDADRRGCALALLGILLVLAAHLLTFALQKPHTAYSQIIFLLLTFLLPGVWGWNLGLAVPAMTTGRPNRFDLWVALTGKLATGGLIAGPAILVWQTWQSDSLLALAFSALLAIAWGGVAIISDEPHFLFNARALATLRRVHVVCILLLYLTLGIVIYTVPQLRPVWYKPSCGEGLYVLEGRGGVGFLTGRFPTGLNWSNAVDFPERTDPILREECGRILRAILNAESRHQVIPLRVLLMGLPAQPKSAFTGLPIAKIDQADYDPVLRELERRTMNLDGLENPLDLVDLYTSRRAYHVVVVFLPTPWPETRSWPGVDPFLSRVFHIAKAPHAVWIISLANPAGQDALPTLSQVRRINRNTGDFHPVTLSSKTGRSWVLAGSRPQIFDITQSIALPRY